MVRTMRPRAVIIDFAIDQGGSVETSRPTTHRDPVVVDEGIVHYCVPNVAARVARTGSHALTNAVLPYLLSIGELGIDDALRGGRVLSRGLNVYRGELVELRERTSMESAARRSRAPVSRAVTQSL
jgi:alanine dehydrogenase